MAHVPAATYEEWLEQLTNLPLRVEIIKNDPPFEMLSILHRRMGEVLRLRAGDVPDYAALGAALPPHFDADDLTLKERLRLLGAFEAEPDLLALCEQKIPSIVEVETSVESTFLSLEKKKVLLTLASMVNETRRKLQELIFRLDDASVRRAMEVMERVRNRR